MVPQDPRLFSATVWENIALGLGPVDQEVAMEGGDGEVMGISGGKLGDFTNWLVKSGDNLPKIGTVGQSLLAKNYSEVAELTKIHAYSTEPNYP